LWNIINNPIFFNKQGISRKFGERLYISKNQNQTEILLLNSQNDHNSGVLINLDESVKYVILKKRESFSINSPQFVKKEMGF